MTTGTPSHPPSTSVRVPDVPEPTSGLGGWFRHGGTPEEATHIHDSAKPWYSVLWLTGVDYFSTLGYQPGIALLAAHALSPIATALLVLFTLFGALPVYHEVARRSYIGQGSIAMLESLLTGWRSKLVMLVMLGFASTAFVITVTLSSADAALHIVENPFVEHYLHHGQLWVTLVLLALLTAVFLKGFSEAIGLAVAVGVPYILLNLVVVGRGFMEIAQHPDYLSNWSDALTRTGDWTTVLLASVIAFPKLALGLSGFETGVAVMPLVKGDPTDATAPAPEGRIRNSRRLLTTAALIMSVLLISTSFVSAVLVPREAYEAGGPAAGRVLAYLSHRLLGPVFGTVYDISTILILWFAGASAITGMLNLVPRYLPRLGMAPRWVAYARPLVLVLFAAEVLVTLCFKAEVEAQGGAYATGVLVLMLSGSIAVALSLGREARAAGSAAGRRRSLYFWLVTAGFVYAIAENVRVRPDGVLIAGVFIAFIVAFSVLSRYSRATELRVEHVVFEDDESAVHWETICCKKVNLVPLKEFTPEDTARKSEEIRRHYKVEGPLAFLHVYLRDDRSDFSSTLRVKVGHDGENYCIEVTGAVALANTIAYLSELIDPISVFLGLTRQNSVGQAFRYLLWGEGETGVLVYEILLRHWRRTPEDDVRPLIFLMSE
ncbi:MAG TPA: hypothetical protein VK689_04125 [Armatimonadota bacterium]|nr:hypothetical protein [Armatimonadota bacterium]